jgi:hypothetical protein
MNKKDWRDYLTAALLSTIILTFMWVVVKNVSSVPMVGTVGGIVGTLLCALRWFDMKDDKQKDAS